MKRISGLDIFPGECIHPSFSNYILSFILNGELLYTYKICKAAKPFYMQGMKICFLFKVKK